MTADNTIYWQTEDGQALKALDGAYGSLPAGEVIAKVQKSGDHADGFAVFTALVNTR